MACSRTSGVMRNSGLVRLVTAGSLGLAATVANADRIVVFADDFEHSRPRSEWSGVAIEHHPLLTRFLGRMTDQEVGLSVPPPAEHQVIDGEVTYYMRFDLITLDGWTGASEDGRDTRFEVRIGENVMFSHSLSVIAGRGTYREPTSPASQVAFGASADGIYRGVLIAFRMRSDEDLRVVFRAIGLSNARDFSSVSAVLGNDGSVEASDLTSWGIDNVEIWCDYNHDGGGSAGREAETPSFDAGDPGVLGGGGRGPLETQGTSVPRPPISTYTPPGPKPLLPPGHTGSGTKAPPAPTVMPPFTPPDETPANERTTPPDWAPFAGERTETPKDSEDSTKVPSPGVLAVMGLGLAATGRRRRAA